MEEKKVGEENKSSFEEKTVSKRRIRRLNLKRRQKIMLDYNSRFIFFPPTERNITFDAYAREQAAVIEWQKEASWQAEKAEVRLYNEIFRQMRGSKMLNQRQIPTYLG